MKLPSNKLTCDIETVQKSLEQSRDPIASMSGLISQMTATIKRIYPLWEQLADGCLHLHSKHYHTISNNSIHDVTDKSITGNACILSSIKGNIDTLMSEQNSFTDLNQTGMIFGRDYAFENHIDLPRFFKSMYNPEVNEYSEDMQENIQAFETFLDIALRDLYPDKSFCSTITTGSTTSNTLILEFFKESDLDGNDKIYGVDFIIESKDTPDELIQLNKSNNLNLPKISWEEYLKSLKQKEIIDMNKCQISPFTKKELIDELIDEFLTCVDQNGDGLIYGKDFIIVSDDRPTQLNQYLPLYLPNIIVTWVSYVKLREYNQPNDLLKYETLLKEEYLQDKDLDGNGLIYGIDFIITDFDCFSDMLVDINDNTSNLPIFSISDYNSTISPYIENYVLDENIQAAKFNAEWRDKVDVDGNGLVYGRDFILSDYEGNKTECLWTIEKYRNFSLSWTPEKLVALKLNGMISDYTQFEFDQYWACSGGTDGPSIPVNPETPPVDNSIVVNYGCDPTQKPIVPLDFNSVDLSDHIILYNGQYWFDLGTQDVNYYSGIFMIPDGTMIDISSLTLDHTFDLFTDSSIYYIKTSKQFSSEDPYVFKIKVDGRKRVYPSNRFFSIVDSCLVFNEDTISDIEQLQESKNYIIVSDNRIDKTVPFNQDLSQFMIRWVYNHETETGKWVLSDYYESLLNRVILIDTVQCTNQICVPSYKQSSEFKHFLPFILNVSWNDI